MSCTASPRDSLGEMIAECRAQQGAWAGLPIRRRLLPVRTFRGLVVSQCDRLCAAAASDLGKPVEETLAAELLPLGAACRFLEREARSILRPRRVSCRQRPVWLWGQHDNVYHRPRGVVGIIGTWNFPLFLNGVQILQALTAGNGVVWKPSELAPASAAALFELLVQAGFPRRLVQPLEATREAGRDLSEAEVDHVVFTGSDATGRELAARLGQRLVSSTLELSGCDAMFVLDDADVAVAAKAAWFGCMLNRGQTCLAVRRVLVHHSAYPKFVDALRPLVAAAPAVRLALESQVRQAERLAGAARAGGARVLEGRGGPEGAGRPGADGPAKLCPVRVVLDAGPGMAVCREASFAPLLAVTPFGTDEEALRLDTFCPYGLGASVFTRNPSRALSLAARLRVGAVTVNDVIVPTAHPATPVGGRGVSGWGVTQGAEGLLAMTVPQVVSVRGGSSRAHFEPPGSTWLGKPETRRGLLEWGYGGSFGQRWRGLRRMMRSLWPGP